MFFKFEAFQFVGNSEFCSDNESGQNTAVYFPYISLQWFWYEIIAPFMLWKTKWGCVELNRVWCMFVVSDSPIHLQGKREMARYGEKQCKWQNHAPNTIHFLSKVSDTLCVLNLSHWDISWPVWRAVKCGKSHTSYFCECFVS